MLCTTKGQTPSLNDSICMQSYKPWYNDTYGTSIGNWLHICNLWLGLDGIDWEVGNIQMVKRLKHIQCDQTKESPLYLIQCWGLSLAQEAHQTQLGKLSSTLLWEAQLSQLSSEKLS